VAEAALERLDHETSVSRVVCILDAFDVFGQY
jgi:hypothetical protein